MDYQGGGPFPLVVTRTYNSGIANELNSPSGLASGMGVGWASNHAPGFQNYGRLYGQAVSTQVVQCPLSPSYECPVTALPKYEVAIWSADGSQQLFLCQADSTGACPFSPEPGSAGQLVPDGNGYDYVRPDGYTEKYTVATLSLPGAPVVGMLAAIQDPHGLQQTYGSYTYTTLGSTQVLQSFRVTDPSGRFLQYNYDVNPSDAAVGMLVTVNTPTGNIYYGYDANHNLVTVTYGDAPNSTVVTYEYNDSALPHALTGLKDEDGDEYAAWSYDDTSGKAICSEHAPSGNVASTATTCSTDTGGADKTVIAYNTDGSADVTEATGLVRHMTFTTVNGRSVFASVDKRCTDCGDTVQQAYYDSNGYLQKTFDFNGNETDYSFSSTGIEQYVAEAVASGVDPQAVTRSISFFPLQIMPNLPRESLISNAQNQINEEIDYCYNYSGGSCNEATSLGAVWTRTAKDSFITHNVPSRTTTYTYTTDGRLLTIDGPLTGVNDVTTYYYYPDATHCPSGFVGNTNDLCMIKDGLGHKTYINQYSAAGFPASITDVNGVVTTLSYDARGRLVSRTLDATGGSSAATTSYAYYNNGLLHTVALPITVTGHAYLTYGYDRAYRVTSVLDDAGESKSFTYTYNTSAKTYSVEEKRFPNGSSTAVYDRVVTRDDLQDYIVDTDGMGHSTTYEHDANGNVTTLHDPLGRETYVTYDGLNRVQQVQDTGGGITTYAYDIFDKPTDITSPRGFDTQYVYDVFGEMLSQVSPDTGTTTYDYSGWVSNSQVIKTDARGKVQTYSYDALSRLLSQTNGQRSYTYTYDNATSGYYGIGRLDTATILGNSEAYRYDSHGMVSRKTTTVGASGQSFIQAYHRDAADILVSVGYPPANGTVIYTLDVLGRVVGVSTNGGGGTTLASSVTYMPFGPISSLTYGNSLKETRDFDTAYRLTGVHTKDGTTPVVQDWTYAYNDDGTISGITDNLTSANSQTFGYDPMQRLVTATGAYGSITIGSDPVNHPELSYDADGNRTQIDAAGTVTSYTYDAASNRLLSSLTGGHTTTYGYDADGSVTSDGTYTYAYDINERVATVQQGSTVEYQAQNNYLGQRISKTVGTTEYGFVYDEQGHLIAELNTDGTIIKEHIWLGDRPLAYYQTNINGSTSADVKYLHVDQVNAPRAMTASTKAIGWTWNSDPWGTTTVSSGSYHIRYPGQYYDQQTGNMQNWMRDYDPPTGRYLQSDPVGLAGGINTYVYVGSNPLIYSDRAGLWVPMMHNRMTQEAAIAAGYPELAANLGSLTAGVDVGTQDPADAAAHAMSDPSKSPEQNEADYEYYLQTNWNEAINNCDLGALARVLHATEDSYAPAHRGLQPWYGFNGTSTWGLFTHLLQDTFANSQTYNDAKSAAAQLIKRYGTCGCH